MLPYWMKNLTQQCLKTFVKGRAPLAFTVVDESERQDMLAQIQSVFKI